MRTNGLLHSMAVYEMGNKNSLKEALKTISNIDTDFNGENGLGYLREEVWNANGYANFNQYEDTCDMPDTDSDEFDSWKEPELKFKSNQEYYIDLALKETDEKKAINNFLHNWLSDDGYYIDWNLKTEDINYYRAISVAILH